MILIGKSDIHLGVMWWFQSVGGETTKAEEVKGDERESSQDAIYESRHSSVISRTETDSESTGCAAG